MKIDFTTHCHTPDEDLARNRGYAKSLGFPRLGEAGSPTLCIAGGGRSLAHNLPQEGEIWAINGAWQWLADKGIDATFCSADSDPRIAGLVKGVKKAFISTHCHPDVFDALKGAEVEAVDVAGNHGYPSGPTTATAFPLHAVDRGHEKIIFYGCESSWKTKTHGYKDESATNVMKVRCNGREFLTQPHLAMQAEIIAALITAAPSVFSEKSGGLLRALTKNPELDVIAATPNIHEALVYDNILRQ